jgi:hypothetical protein
MSTIAHTSSTEYKHEDTCDLFDRHHTIPDDVAAVVEAFDDLEGCRAVAAGCNTCTSYALANDEDVSAYVYYVAQSDPQDGSVYFGYGGHEAEAVAHQLIGVAAGLGIEWDWSGDISKKVRIGGGDD